MLINAGLVEPKKKHNLFFTMDKPVNIPVL